MTERVLIVPIATDEWWGPLVRWFLRSKFNHIFILFEDATLGGWCAREARSDGVYIVDAEKSSLTRMKYAEFYEHNDSMAVAMKESMNIIGIGYDWLGLMSNIFRLFLWKILKVKWLKPVHAPGRHTCAEDTLSVLRLVPVSGIGILEPSTTMPGEIRDFLLKSTDFHTVENPIRSDRGKRG